MQPRTLIATSLFLLTCFGCVSAPKEIQFKKIHVPDEARKKEKKSREKNDVKQANIPPKLKATIPKTSLLSYCEDDIYSKYLASEFRKKKQQSSRGRVSRFQTKHYVSHRIEGYASNQYYGALPVVETPRLEVWLDYFTTRGRKDFLKWLVRSESYRDVIPPLLKQEGVPQELFYLAMIESGFSNTAYSRAKAIGTWQFMKQTGLHYGLKVDYWVDERRDPVKATIAASRFLKDLYRKFGDWYLAIAAYNAGPGKIRRAIRKTQSRDFWKISKSRYLRKETKHYIPKMLAALTIASDPQKYGFQVIANHRYHTPAGTVLVKSPTRLSEIAARLNIRSSFLQRWNPELLKGITPPINQKKTDGYKLRLPEIYRQEFAKVASNFDTLNIKDVTMYRIRSGDTLSSIAARHKVSLRRLIEMNPHIHPKRMRPGHRIAVPIPVIIQTTSNEAS